MANTSEQMHKENAELQQRIIAQWKTFSGTEAYKDWVESMNQTMQMIQDNVDNMTEMRGKELTPIDSERCGLLNQRKVGIRYAIQYPQLRIEAD